MHSQHKWLFLCVCVHEKTEGFEQQATNLGLFMQAELGHWPNDIKIYFFENGDVKSDF